MEAGQSTFTVVKSNTVYVVTNVPSYVCPDCGHTAFNQETTKRLESFASGRMLPLKAPIRAWVYDWFDPSAEIPKNPVPTQITNDPIVFTLAGTVQR
ncbi:MAG: hypothetical protein HY680_01470 [Chloroflexi bacterium]|nr:hypothetical protein [Chloroflexota bacterium]